MQKARRSLLPAYSRGALAAYRLTFASAFLPPTCNHSTLGSTGRSMRPTYSQFSQSRSPFTDDRPPLRTATGDVPSIKSKTSNCRISIRVSAKPIPSEDGRHGMPRYSARRSERQTRGRWTPRHAEAL
jgi:hypothetical protein